MRGFISIFGLIFFFNLLEEYSIVMPDNYPTKYKIKLNVANWFGLIFLPLTSNEKEIIAANKN